MKIAIDRSPTSINAYRLISTIVWAYNQLSLLYSQTDSKKIDWKFKKIHNILRQASITKSSVFLTVYFSNTENEYKRYLSAHLVNI